jgi:hypothetical protein
MALTLSNCIWTLLQWQEHLQQGADGGVSPVQGQPEYAEMKTAEDTNKMLASSG